MLFSERELEILQPDQVKLNQCTALNNIKLWILNSLGALLRDAVILHKVVHTNYGHF